MRRLQTLIGKMFTTHRSSVRRPALSPFMQKLGFVMILIGVAYMASFLLPSGIIDKFSWMKLEDKPVAEGMAIAFFIAMLGVSFAFPSMLEGNEGLSTMRIVVFMMVNVICLLLIKIGWEAPSFKEIEINQYWVGIIAFIFGAKATQAFFESRMAEPRPETLGDSTDRGSSTANLHTIQTLIDEHQEELKSEYGAEAVRPALKVRDGRAIKVPCLQFVVTKKNEKNKKLIPEYINYLGTNIPTDVVEESMPVENAKIYPGDGIRRKNCSFGTIGLKVYRETNGKRTNYLLSCFHVFCNPELKSQKTTFERDGQDNDVFTSDSSAKIGTVVEGYFNSKIDAALCELDSNADVSSRIRKLADNPKCGIRIITDEDVMEQKTLFITGYASSNSRSGQVISRKVDQPVEIFGTKYEFKNVIPATKMSDPGDSGAAVIDDTGRVVGIIFASNNTTSYIIPITEIILQLKFKINYAI